MVYYTGPMMTVSDYAREHRLYAADLLALMDTDPTLEDVPSEQAETVRMVQLDSVVVADDRRYPVSYLDELAACLPEPATFCATWDAETRQPLSLEVTTARGTILRVPWAEPDDADDEAQEGLKAALRADGWRVTPDAWESRTDTEGGRVYVTGRVRPA